MEEKKMDLFVRSVDRGVWEAFKIEAVRKHGKLHGVLGGELTRALELYLKGYPEEAGSTHTHRTEEKKEQHPHKEKDNSGMYTNGGTPANKGMRTYETIKTNTSDLVDVVYNGGDVSVKAFTRIIKRHAGLDQRTIKKYLDLLFDEYDLGVVHGYVRLIL